MLYATHPSGSSSAALLSVRAFLYCARRGSTDPITQPHRAHVAGVAPVVFRMPAAPAACIVCPGAGTTRSPGRAGLVVQHLCSGLDASDKKRGEANQQSPLLLSVLQRFPPL